MRRNTTASRILQLVSTSLVWSFMLALSGWALAAGGWVILTWLWRRELVVADNMRTTGQATLLFLGWAAVVLIAALWWANYNYQRYYLNDKRTRAPLQRPEGPSWREIAAGMTGEQRQLVPIPEESGEGEPLQVTLERVGTSPSGEEQST